MIASARLLDLPITGIGSLPHHNVDSALEHVALMDIPYLPQIPIRNPREYMVGQALDGLPGLENDPEGGTALNLDVWTTEASRFGAKLEAAFGQMSKPDAFREFEPESSSWAAWNPFLWDADEKRTSTLKLQIAGPLTCQWTLRDTRGALLPEDVRAQVYRLILARAISMIRRARRAGHEVLFFIDEPGLYLLDLKSLSHVTGLQELKLCFQMLKKEGAVTGLHCCSNTHWAPVLSLQPDYLSFDAHLSLPAIFECGSELDRYWASGGRFALGIVPTNPKSQELPVDLLWSKLKAIVPTPFWPRLFEKALLTPACGLALHTPETADAVLAKLRRLQTLAREELRS